jgi:hypothetical protein
VDGIHQNNNGLVVCGIPVTRTKLVIKKGENMKVTIIYEEPKNPTYGERTSDIVVQLCRIPNKGENFVLNGSFFRVFDVESSFCSIEGCSFVVLLKKISSEEYRKNIISMETLNLSEIEGISVRTKNFLRMANIKTIQDVSSHTESEMSNYTNSGRKVILELGKILEDHGMKFKSI